MREIITGIIGCGRIGRLHAENILSRLRNAVVKTVSDIYTDGLEEWAYSLGIDNVCSDYREIINDSEIEAVLISSSTETHGNIIIEAAKAGKHIFCEKPIALDVITIRKAIEAVEESGVKLQVGFNRRFDHNFRSVRNLIKSGKIGDMHIIKITSRDPSPPSLEYIKISGGIFLDMTIHDFDMMRYLSGSEVEEVFAQGNALVDPAIGRLGDLDTTVVFLKLDNGALGVIDNSRKAVYGYDQRVEVFGSKGCVTVSNDFPNTSLVFTEVNVYREKPLHFFMERYRESFIEELRQFFNCIVNNKETTVDGNDGLQPVLIGLAAKKSFLEKRVIRIDEI